MDDAPSPGILNNYTIYVEESLSSFSMSNISRFLPISEGTLAGTRFTKEFSLFILVKSPTHIYSDMGFDSQEWS